MNKGMKEDFKILQNIFKNVLSKKHKCLVCPETSINSHLLQKNGILNLISDNNHITQIQSKDFFSMDEKGIIDIKKVGINNAMSYPLFCNLHDTNIFASIEKQELNLDNYINQLLFSYRSLCAEIRKKMNNVDIFERVKNSSHFSSRESFLNIAEMQIEANSFGIEDMNWYKNNFELEINDINEPQNFIFEKIDFDFIPVSVSAVYSPIDPTEHTLDVLKNREKILNYIFINLIPQEDKLTLIIGYHRQKSDNWILEYISSWKDLSQSEFEYKLTDLLATKIETWSISPEYFFELNPKTVDLFKKYWNDHASDLRVTQKINFNLFE